MDDIAVDDIIDVEPVADPVGKTIEDVEAELAALLPPEEPKTAYTPPKGATWAYATEMDTAERGIPEEWVWERLRVKRDALLAASDYRVAIPDAPWDTAPWLVYRQALRDMTLTADPRKAVWPVVPA